MIAKLRLALAALLFLGWLGWLAYTVSRKGTVQVVSRAQLAGAKYWAVVEIDAEPDGTPKKIGKVKQTFKRNADDPELALGAILVSNLHRAKVPLADANGSRTPLPGDYLLPLIETGKNVYAIAGLPRSPGQEAQDMDSPYDPANPVIYAWTAEVQKQIDGFLK